MWCADPRWRCLAFGLLLAGSAAPGREPPLDMQVGLAWKGVLSRTMTTEAAVDLSSDRGLPLRLLVSGVRPGTVVTLRLEPGVPRRIWIPLTVSGDRPVRFEAFSGEHRLGGRGVWPLPGRRALVVLALAQAGWIHPAATDEVRYVGAAAHELPRTIQGYGPVAAMAMDAGSLSSLDLRQQQAFEAYLARCGRAVLMGLPPAAWRALTDAAGCDSGMVARVEAPEQLALVLGKLLSAEAATAPDEAALRRLALALPSADAPDSSAWRVLAFLAVYALVLVLLVARRKGGGPVLLLVPVAAAAVALLTWYRVPPSTTVLAWLEQTSPGTADMHAVVRVRGQGLGETALPLAPGLLPDAAPGRASQRISVDAGGALRSLVHVPGRLLSASSVILAGTVHMTSPLGLRVEGKVVTVANPTTGAAPPAVLLWQARAVAVPALAPGATWTSERAVPVPGSPQVRLALRRTPPGSASLLLPATPPGTSGRGWLLVPAGVTDVGR